MKAGFFLMLITAGTGVAAYLIGEWTSRTVFIMTSLVAAILLLVVNSHSNEQARNRMRLVQLHRELAEQHEFLKTLSPIGSLQGCADHIVKVTSERLRCQRVSIMLPDENNEYLYIASSCGLPDNVIDKTRIPIGECVAGRVFQSDGPIHVIDTKAATETSDLPIDSTTFMSGPLLLSGMRWGSTRLGVLSVTQPTDREDFDINDEFIFSNICEASAVAIYNHMAVAKVKQSNVEFLDTLINAIEARDKYTRGHSERVGKYSSAIGRRLLLTRKSLADLHVIAKLHDIGKIGIPDAILQKPGPLTEEEWQIIRQHTDIGTRMLAEASLVSSAIDAVRDHHERLNGSGYPRGLTRPEIPLLARIIAVADSFDAMTSARPYREPLSVAEALAELKREGDLEYDPVCVNALVEALNSGELEPRNIAEQKESQPANA